jgi:ankyrin repeat protein
MIDNDVCLLKVCGFNNNLERIKYFIDDLKMDISKTDRYGYNCLMYACYENENSDIIKYLIEDKKISVSETNVYGQTCLMAACRNNKNLNVIKYLIEDKKMDISQTDCEGRNSLMFACYENKNIDVIRYLVKETKINLNQTDKKGYTCLQYACEANENLEIIKYLIEETNVEMKISFEYIPFVKFKQFIKLITKNYFRLNKLLDKALNEYEYFRMIDLLRGINPLLLSNNVRIWTKIANPFDSSYDKFIVNVDNLECTVLNISDIKKLERKKETSCDIINLTQLLFKHNNIRYYGDINSVFDAIYVLNDLQKYDRSEPIILSGEIPKYIMHMYIQSCYNGEFKMNEIKVADFESFLKFIDQYPTKYVSIDLLEIDLIKYMESNNICPDDYIKIMCNKYRLKYMYMYIKQKISFENMNKKY